MGLMSRNKGKVGEREVRDLFREAGFTARRGQQFAGGPDSPDVKVAELDADWHWEVKRVEKLNLRDAVDQAKRDAGTDKQFAVFHRRNNSPWLVTLDACQFIELLKENPEISP